MFENLWFITLSGGVEIENFCEMGQLSTQRYEGAGLFWKNIEKQYLCRHDKNYYYFCKSNIPVINLIVDSRNMIKVSKNMSL